MDCDRGSPSPAVAALISMHGSNLLSPDDDEHEYSAEPYRSSASSTPPHRSMPVSSLPPIHTTALPGDNVKYRDDELTGMAGLMELASPEHKHYMRSVDAARYPLPPSYGPATPHNHHFVSAADTYSSSTSTSNSTASHVVPPALNLSASSNSASTYASAPYPTPGQQHYSQQQHYHSQQHYHGPLHSRYPLPNSATSIESPQSAVGATLTPDSLPPSHTMPRGTRSFPATVDDVQIARRRSQSTDSAQSTPYHLGNSLPYVLGNANIRNRSFTAAQRQRTSDTPLFPILLHRIIEDSENESWIRWCEDGKAFKFSSADNLLSSLQAAGLRAQNYHSIEKNLNDYRFIRLTDQRRKIPDPDGKLWWMFSHPQFLRDLPDGIVNIQRRRRTNPPPVSPQPPAIPTQPQPQIQHHHHHHQAHLQSQPLYPPAHQYQPQQQHQSQQQQQGTDIWM
ncbi:Heat shock transcription factor [Coemansia aciculifera]|uniref:Heat shock transcription factor n=2 Tax=Coemansia TaxID=4863 RepID=A0A9W8M395_9FUNG|nr:Heat shock transcription factor [Coemansia aciculifera]